MRLGLCEIASDSGGDHNEDRVGRHGAPARVIDGATDVPETRLLPGPSDAAWFADALNLALMRHATGSPRTLDDCVTEANVEARARFESVALRAVARRYEQPSAAGIVLRLADGHLEALGLGDCTLLALSEDRAPLDLFQPNGKRDADSEIRAAIAQVRRERPDTAHTGVQGVRASPMPRLRAKPDRLNTTDGYGVFSIDLPPEQHVAKVRRPVRSGDLFLFAADGFMRLVGIFGLYSLEALGEAIRRDGLARLTIALRKIETEDSDCRRFARTKAMDDSTAMIVEVTG